MRQTASATAAINTPNPASPPNAELTTPTSAISLDLADQLSRLNADAHTRALLAAASKISAAMRRDELARAI